MKKSRVGSAFAALAAATALALSVGTAVPAGAAGESGYALPDYSPQFEVVENQCANVMTGDVAEVRCWTENGTDMIMRLKVVSSRYKNTARLRVQKTTALVASQGSDEPASGRTYTFLEPAGRDADGYPYFVFSMEKWATQAVEVALMPSERALTINFNVNRGSLAEPIVLREADSKQGNFWRLSEPLHITAVQPNGATNTVTFEATAENAAEAANITGVSFFRADPDTYLYDGSPQARTVVGMSGRYPVTSPVVCPGDSCTLSVDEATGKIVWTAEIPAEWQRLQYIMDVTGRETSHPYRVRRAFQAQLVLPEPKKIPVPATPEVSDPCGPDNAAWVVPSDSQDVRWVLGETGELSAVTVGDVVFDDGRRSIDFGVAPDSGEACPTPTEEPTPSETTPEPTPTTGTTPDPSGDPTPSDPTPTTGTTPDPSGDPTPTAPVPVPTSSTPVPLPSASVPSPTLTPQPTPAGSSTRPSAKPTATLPSTGSDVWPGAGLAVVLAVIGGAVVAVTRRWNA
ncbi:MAG: LPXTG cell wall anchor domain-containing protein [Actinomycetaceae bacterium]|nr:LPXTG cell wall anchor domain-containing protein [Actinomycetaceae bacterium]